MDQVGGYRSVTKADAVEVRFRPGSASEQFAKRVLSRAVDARRDLEGLGNEAQGQRAIIYLEDSFPDPEDPATFVSAGCVVDDERCEIWMVATPESPPEEPHRPLALLFGAGLPAADDVEFLLEGYALHLADVESTRPALTDGWLPQLEAADGEVRRAMAVDYVRYLLDREGDQALRELLNAPKGKLESTFQQVYGMTSASMELAWRTEVAAGEPEVETAEFLRTSLQYLRPYWLRQIEIFAYMLLSLAFTAAFPFVTRELFDNAIPSGDFSEVLTLLVILGIAFTVSLVAGLRQAYLSAWVSGAVGRDLRQKLFDRLQIIPTAWFRKYSQGDILARLFSDIGSVQSSLTGTIGEGLYQSLTVVVAGVIMLSINVPLGVVVLAAAPLVALVYKAMSKGARERSMDTRQENSALLTVAAENYNARQVVKLFGLRRRENQRFGRQADRFFDSQRRLSLFGGIFGLSVNMIVTILRLGVLGFGSWLILEDRLTIGGLMAFLAIMGEVISPITVLTSLGQDVQATSGALSRVDEVLEAETEPGDDRPDLEPLRHEIVLSDIAYSYGGDRRVLDGLDATIPLGASVAFVGPSGSGKSTVLRLIMRLMDPDDGMISIDGVDTRSASMRSLRDQMAVVFQEPFLFNTTIRENVRLGKADATDEEVIAAIDAAQLTEAVASMPNGLDSLVGERGTNLSGGQRQRVSIARALVRDPRILILDEATSGLDAATERGITETLDKVGSDRTVISVTHRLSSIVNYDTIFVLEAGRLVEHGTHQELLSLGGVYGELWSEQTGAEKVERAPLDVTAALGATVLFRDLDGPALRDVANRLRSFVMQPGDEVHLDGKHLYLLSKGTAAVVAPTIGGRTVVAATVAAGDVVGVRTILGDDDGSVLRALETVAVLELDNAALDGIAARFESVAAVIDTTTPGAGGPSAGRRVTPTTMSPA